MSNFDKFIITIILNKWVDKKSYENIKETKMNKIVIDNNLKETNRKKVIYYINYENHEDK